MCKVCGLRAALGMVGEGAATLLYVVLIMPLIFVAWLAWSIWRDTIKPKFTAPSTPEGEAS